MKVEGELQNYYLHLISQFLSTKPYLSLVFHLWLCIGRKCGLNIRLWWQKFFSIFLAAYKTYADSFFFIILLFQWSCVFLAASNHQLANLPLVPPFISNEKGKTKHSPLSIVLGGPDWISGALPPFFCFSHFKTLKWKIQYAFLSRANTH